MCPTFNHRVCLLHVHTLGSASLSLVVEDPPATPEECALQVVEGIDQEITDAAKANKPVKPIRPAKTAAAAAKPAPPPKANKLDSEVGNAGRGCCEDCSDFCQPRFTTHTCHYCTHNYTCTITRTHTHHLMLLRRWRPCSATATPILMSQRTKTTSTRGTLPSGWGSGGSEITPRFVGQKLQGKADPALRPRVLGVRLRVQGWVSGSHAMPWRGWLSTQPSSLTQDPIVPSSWAGHPTSKPSTPAPAA